jgi:uncharacterized membrane protein YfcA
MPLHIIFILLLIGLSAGLLSGLLGVGGAVIIIPALLLLPGISQHHAQGTALGMLSIPVALGGALNYYRGGYINLKYVLFLSVAFFIGGYIGSLFALQMPDKVLKKIFAFFLLIISLKMIFEK